MRLEVEVLIAWAPARLHAELAWRRNATFRMTAARLRYIAAGPITLRLDALLNLSSTNADALGVCVPSSEQVWGGNASVQEITTARSLAVKKDSGRTIPAQFVPRVTEFE